MTFALLTPSDLAGLVVVAGVLIFGLTRRGKRFDVSVGKLHASVEDIASKVTAVDRAVNNRPAGDPTLYEMVRAQGLKVDDAATLGHRTAVKVETIGTQLTTHLAHHQAERERAGA